jgi:hypothetical protein
MEKTCLSSSMTDKSAFEIESVQSIRNHVLHDFEPTLWRLSSRPALKESYRFHSHLTVQDHTMSLAHHYQSKSSSDSIYLNDSVYRVHNSHSLLPSNTNGKHSISTSSIELDHPYSCSSRRVNQALRTLTEPSPPSPSSSPSPPLPLSSSHTLSTPQQMILISTPPTPPPSSTVIHMDMDISQQHQQTDQQQFYTKSSSAFILSPSAAFFPSHQHPYVLSSTPPLVSAAVSQQSSPSLPVQPSSPISSKQGPSSCGRVQLVQLHRIHPTTKTHKFASSTPVTTSDS